MDPVFFQAGRITVYWYGVLVATSFLAAVVHWNLMARRYGYPRGFGSEIAFWIMIGGIAGARIAYVAANLPHYWANPAEIVMIQKGGLIYYGGFLGGCLAVILYARKTGLPLWPLADFCITAVPLSHAIGRVGCFVNGCCYGSESDLPWHVLAHDAWRHPTQLYETGLNLAVYASLVWLARRRPRGGSVIALYLLTYPVARFLTELFRGDDRQRWAGLSTAQWLSVALFAGGLVLWRRLLRGGDRPADPPGSDRA